MNRRVPDPPAVPANPGPPVSGTPPTESTGASRLHAPPRKAADPAGRGPAPDPYPAKTVLLALAALGLAFAPTVASFPVMWWNRYGYIQGYVLAAVVVYVLRRDREQLFPPGPHAPPILVPALLLLSAAWLAAQVMSVQVAFQFAFVLILTGWALYVLGLRSWSVIAPAGATLMLGVPVWDGLIPILREMAVLMSGLFVRILGVPAEIQGDVIIIEWGSFIVENGCAGQAYLLVGLTVGALYSHLFMRGWTTRLGVVALAGGMALLSNWIRITHLVWLGHATQMQSSIIRDHNEHGWVVFTLSLIPFFALARWMERWNEPPGQAGDEAAPWGPPPHRATWRRRLGVATVAACAGPLLYWSVSLLPPARGREVVIEPAGAGWVAVPSADGGEARVGAGEVHASGPAPPWEIAYAGVDRRADSRWTRAGSPVPVFGERLVYARQRQGAELINGLNRIAPDSLVRQERTVGPLDRNGTTVRETWVQAGEEAWLVWHWYRVAGIATASPARAKLLELVAFLTRRRQAELVTLTAPCGPESCQGAARSLFHFVTGEELPVEEEEGAGGTGDGGPDVGTGDGASDALPDPGQDQADDAADDGGHEELRGQ